MNKSDLIERTRKFAIRVLDLEMIKELDNLINESSELTAIFTKSVKTLSIT